ncbi:hypothetical protein PX52LOC_00920 [Limnoglobus roseus]|uniref:Uncharacterized protein n=2 Tax=Limnoglobus roseus TaxID=2598579 RepID=A0A5C1A783_9BACT|nr:hypothetical protein PX52LOC_00920 [Limnoglobus roseus]
MVGFHTAATIAPSLILWVAIYQLWAAVEELPQFLVFVFVLSLLPLAAQLGLWFCRQIWNGLSVTVTPPHPFGLALPLSLLLLIPMWPAGAWVANQVPDACETVAGEEVRTTLPTAPNRTAVFSVQVHGWGNSRAFGFNGGVVVYTGRGRPGAGPPFEDLYFDLARQRGHWTNSYTTFIPLTREVVGEYVRRSDNFPPGEAEAIADQIWDALNRYAEKRDLPPMIDHFHTGEGPRIVSYAPTSISFLFSCALALLPLAVGSWLLARRYCSRALTLERERLPV